LEGESATSWLGEKKREKRNSHRLRKSLEEEGEKNRPLAHLFKKGKEKCGAWPVQRKAGVNRRTNGR